MHHHSFPGTPVCSWCSFIRPFMPEGPLPTSALAKEQRSHLVSRVGYSAHLEKEMGISCKLPTFTQGHTSSLLLASQPKMAVRGKLKPHIMVNSRVYPDSKLKDSQIPASLIRDSCQEADAVRKLPPQGVPGLGSVLMRRSLQVQRDSLFWAINYFLSIIFLLCWER